jgi:hypothetical protein
MTSAKGALYQVLYPYLRDYGGVWGMRVEPLAVATAGLDKPCVQFFYVGGGRELSVPRRDSQRIMLAVKCVAETMQVAVDGQEQISAALHNAGEQDVDPRLPSHDGWHILTVTEEEEVWVEEMFEGTQRIYHAGHRYEFLMERRA